MPALNSVLVSISVIMLIGLSGCIVDPDENASTELSPLETNFLHIYENGDRIEYELLINIQNKDDPTQRSTTSGTMIVDYQVVNSIVENPLVTNSPLISLIRETTTLNWDSDSAQSVRYFKQDTETDDILGTSMGSVRLYAYQGQGPGSTTPADIRLNYTGNTQIVEPVLFLKSPIPTTRQIDSGGTTNFFVMPNCGAVSSPTSCSPAMQRYFRSYEYNSSELIIDTKPTLLGRFESIKVPYDAQAIILDSNANLIRLDARTFCDISNFETHAFKGTDWIYPEIGVVAFEFSCNPGQSGNFTYSVIGNISATTIRY